MSVAFRTFTRALSVGALPLLLASAAHAQRTTAPVNRPVREPMARLPKPEGLAVSQLSATSVRLTWRAVDGAKGYVLGRSIGTNGFQRINIPLSRQTEYTDSEVRVGVRVAYSVTAVDSSDMASPRAITPDFIPTAMAPDPVATVDSTAADSTARDSTAGPATPGPTTGGATPRKEMECPSRTAMDGLPVIGTVSHMSHREEIPSLEVKLSGASISTEWRYRTREAGTWELWDLVNGVAHFVARAPAGTRAGKIGITRPGRHIPLLYVPIRDGYVGPVCGTPIVVTEQMFDDLARSGSGSAPASSASPSTSSASSMPTEVAAPIALKVRESVALGAKVLAQEWVSLDPDIARLERGSVLAVSPGVARIIGLTGYTDGTVRVNVMSVTVTGSPPRPR